jgi:hypothetical protein
VAQILNPAFRVGGAIRSITPRWGMVGRPCHNSFMDCMALATNTHTHCIRRHPHLATVEPSPAVTWAIAFISFLPHPSLKRKRIGEMK